MQFHIVSQLYYHNSCHTLNLLSESASLTLAVYIRLSYATFLTNHDLNPPQTFRISKKIRAPHVFVTRFFLVNSTQELSTHFFFMKKLLISSLVDRKMFFFPEKKTNEPRTGPIDFTRKFLSLTCTRFAVCTAQ